MGGFHAMASRTPPESRNIGTSMYVGQPWQQEPSRRRQLTLARVTPGPKPVSGLSKDRRGDG
eukprot:4465694-Amphidinium_carterae.1